MKIPIPRGWWPPLAVGLALGAGIAGGVALWCAHVAAMRSRIVLAATVLKLQQAEGLLRNSAPAAPRRTEIERLRCRWAIGMLQGLNELLSGGKDGREMPLQTPQITNATLMTWHGRTLLTVGWIGYQNNVKSVELTSPHGSEKQTIMLRPGDAASYPPTIGGASWVVAEPGWPAPAPPKYASDVSPKITLHPGMLKQGTDVCLKYVNGHESHFVPLLFYPLPAPGKPYHP